MQSVVSPFIPFPNIYWWSVVLAAGNVCFDRGEHFAKMSYRNRYYITGGNGLIQLNVPLTKGREQRTAMGGVGISNKENWQVQHWRTLVSVYNRSPYFQHYELSLKEVFEREFTSLADFNLASIEWLRKQLKADIQVSFADSFQKDYGAGYIDLRHMKPGIEREPVIDAPYYQAFNERNGFLPNLSMLDLLFAEGPYAVRWLRAHKDMVDTWVS
jgi:hypothetical protein